MEAFALMGFIFGMTGFTFGLTAFTMTMAGNKKLKDLEERIAVWEEDKK
ncbi:hypothetical protein U0355_01825 [Salimicrobium sp. PL1-032A]